MEGASDSTLKGHSADFMQDVQCMISVTQPMSSVFLEEYYQVCKKTQGYLVFNYKLITERMCLKLEVRSLKGVENM